MKSVLILASLFLLVVIAQSFGDDSSNRLLQSTTRTATVGKMCASFSSRTTIVDSKSAADADTNKNAMKSTFKVTGYIKNNVEILSSVPQSVIPMELGQEW